MSFGHESDEEQGAELVVELLHGSEPHEVELVVVCRSMVLISRAARAMLGKPGLTVDTERLTRVGCKTA